MSYSFCREYQLVTLRLVTETEEPVPSITQIYPCAFLQENEAAELFGVEWRLDLSHMGKEDRDARLRELKKLGLSVRQLERLTGIGRGVIQRC